MLMATVFAAGAMVLSPSPARSQAIPTAKCSAAKIKCGINRTKGLLDCHRKAESKGVVLDPLCVQKVADKFSYPLKGCMEKAEAKPPCVVDDGLLADKVDAFVDDVVTSLDPAFPAATLDQCGAGKKKCVANRVKAILGCHRKFVTTVDYPKFALCVQKAEDKFDGGMTPVDGCFAKLEAKYNPSATPCQTTGDVLFVATMADAFIADVLSGLL
jgi:hypothetical protein